MSHGERAGGGSAGLIYLKGCIIEVALVWRAYVCLPPNVQVRRQLAGVRSLPRGSWVITIVAKAPDLLSHLASPDDNTASL